MKNIFKILCKTLFLLLVLELFLGFYFQVNTKRFQNKNIENQLKSEAYSNLSEETIQTIFNEQYQTNSSWAPNIHYKHAEFHGKTINVDKNGHRATKNFHTKVDSTAYRIFCFGGSTMLSTGARDNYTIPSELSKLIHENFPNKKYTVTNFGHSGYNRNTETIQLQQELLKGNIPDLVIFYDGVNEVVTTFENKEAGLPSNAFYLKNSFGISHNYPKKIMHLIQTSNIIKAVRAINPKKSGLNKPLFSTEELSNKALSNYKNNIILCNALANEYNFEVINFFQPVIYSKSSLTESEKDFAKHNEYLKDLYNQFYSEINVSSVLKSNENFFNISNALNGKKSTIYTDFCHISEIGNKIVADTIFSHLDLENKFSSKKAYKQTETTLNSQ